MGTIILPRNTNTSGTTVVPCFCVFRAQIGNVLFKGVSRGQMRRASIGVELVAQRKMLFLGKMTCRSIGRLPKAGAMHHAWFLHPGVEWRKCRCVRWFDIFLRVFRSTYTLKSPRSQTGPPPVLAYPATLWVRARVVYRTLRFSLPAVMYLLLLVVTYGVLVCYRRFWRGYCRR